MEKHMADAAAQCLQDSLSGAKHFGQIVAALQEAGIESYFADYRGACTTYYAGGQSLALPLPMPEQEIADRFDAAAVQEAIRGAQRGEVKYPRFKQLTMAAGCIGYMTWIAGRHVAYFGRRGEVHVERFPS
ncbi:DUF1398 family protein [Herbaspirillum sp. LeCh32-8]|nr:DUF1398 family protein [Herbaspirillum sp. LeCh32-8]